MTTEEIKFWMDIFHSPVAIALASGVAGSLITLVVTLLKLHHDSNENKKSWERQEQRRIEERAFKKRQKPMKNFSNISKRRIVRNQAISIDFLLHVS